MSSLNTWYTKQDENYVVTAGPGAAVDDEFGSFIQAIPRCVDTSKGAVNEGTLVDLDENMTKRTREADSGEGEEEGDGHQIKKAWMLIPRSSVGDDELPPFGTQLNTRGPAWRSRQMQSSDGTNAEAGDQERNPSDTELPFVVPESDDLGEDTYEPSEQNERDRSTPVATSSTFRADSDDKLGSMANENDTDNDTESNIGDLDDGDYTPKPSYPTPLIPGNNVGNPEHEEEDDGEVDETEDELRATPTQTS
ncbi:hypothetical protein CBER1_04918 [Cercospora berteroae]|uniref:Uncharacterized protein n=1 Tax=Cercospora berteroae TaxID=357750 RepID=A0A2S6CJE6_9PEZI|nr:hypothetical protein CBER1_04918 [Cercospora berteroae]